MSCEGNSKTTASAPCFLKALLAYIIRKTMGWVLQNDGFHFTKRRVYFLRGFHTPLFLLWVLSPKFALSSLRGLNLMFAWGLSRHFCSFWVGAFVRFASVFRSFLLLFRLFLRFLSTFVCLGSFFLSLFGGFDFVRIFAVENEPWFYMGIDWVPHEPWLIFFVCYRQIRRDLFL